MKTPHNHTENDADLVTYHASTSTAGIARHMEAVHGWQGNLLFTEIRQRHAEEHALALSPEDQGKSSEAENRRYAGALLRRLVTRMFSEIDHAALSGAGEDNIDITTLDEVGSWLSGLAIRVENGADL